MKSLDRIALAEAYLYSVIYYTTTVHSVYYYGTFNGHKIKSINAYECRFVAILDNVLPWCNCETQRN